MLILEENFKRLLDAFAFIIYIYFFACHGLMSCGELSCVVVMISLTGAHRYILGHILRSSSCH